MTTAGAGNLPKLTRERVGDSVLSLLRQSILSQAFRPGQRLNVAEVAERLDVSITPVKEAINRLVSEGLVRIVPRSGTFVADLVPEEVEETFQVREALECRAAELAVGHLTPEVLQRVRNLVAALRVPVRTEADRLAHERSNKELHTLIVELAGNQRLLRMYRDLDSHVAIARIHYSRQGWGERVDMANAEHQEILDALEARSAERLVAALRRHIRRAGEALVEDLRKQRG